MKSISVNSGKHLSLAIPVELKSGLDDEFKDRFDIHIQSAIDTIESCNRWEEIKE